MQSEHLYIHIPFCAKICPYCDFFKIKKNTDEMIDEYLISLKKELSIYYNQNCFKTIYLGGGTPSCLSINQLDQLFRLISPLANRVQEYSIELNPESTSLEKLELFKSYNVNRLSIGVQTSNLKLLKTLNRQHHPTQVEELVSMARALGFNNLSFDLIYNLYQQTEVDIIDDLKFIAKLRPEHLSWYSLILKPNSVWGKKYLQLPNNDEKFDNLINHQLPDLGYQRYEISNYSLKPAYFSMHNLGYWTNHGFCGCGPGASGYINNGQFGSYLTNNSRQYKKWYQTNEHLSQRDYYFQILMMGLRLVDGINFKTTYDGASAVSFFANDLVPFIKNNWLIQDKDGLRCTTTGYNLLDEILVKLV